MSLEEQVLLMKDIISTEGDYYILIERYLQWEIFGTDEIHCCQAFFEETYSKVSIGWGFFKRIFAIPG